MAVVVKTGFPRIEVKARISADLHRRMLEECGICACHINGFIAIAIAHEVASRKVKRNKEAAQYIEEIAGEIEANPHA